MFPKYLSMDNNPNFQRFRFFDEKERELRLKRIYILVIMQISINKNRGTSSRRPTNVILFHSSV